MANAFAYEFAVYAGMTLLVFCKDMPDARTCAALDMKASPIVVDCDRPLDVPSLVALNSFAALFGRRNHLRALFGSQLPVSCNCIFQSTFPSRATVYSRAQLHLISNGTTGVDCPPHRRQLDRASVRRLRRLLCWHFWSFFTPAT